MPTYTINGKKVTSDQPLSDKDIEEIANSFQESGTANKEPTMLQKAKDIAISGFTQGLETLGTVGSYLDFGGTGVSPEERVARTKQESQAIQQAAGTDASQYERGALNQAMKAPFDPTTYIGAPLKGGAALLNVIQAMGGSAGAEALSDGGTNVVGSILGGVAGAGAAGSIPSAFKGVNAAVKAKQSIPSILSDLSDRNVKDFVSQITTSDPSFKDKLKDMEDVIQKVNKLGTDADIKDFQTASPFFFSALTNPAGSGFFTKAAKGDPAMQAILRKELDNIRELKARSPEKYGADAPATFEVKKTDAEIAIENKIKQQETEIKRITGLMNSRTSSTSRQELGNEIVRAIQVKEEAARALLTKRYEKLKTAKGVKVGREQVIKLVEGFKEDALYNAFVAVPSDLKTIISKLYQIGKVDGKEVALTTDLNAKDVIDLKNAINRAKRDTEDPTSKDIIKAFENNFEKVRKTFPKGFDDRLREADEMYRESVAIPFVTDSTIKSAKDSDFRSDVVRALVSKPESVDSIVNALGKKQAEVFVKKATYFNAFDSAFDVNKGTLDPAKLKTYLFKNREVLNKFPELRDNLLKTSNDLVAFEKEIVRLKEEQRAYSESFSNGFFSAFSSGRANTEKVAGQLLGSQSRFASEQVVKDITERLTPEDGKIVFATLREEMLKKVFNQNLSLSDQIRRNESSFKAIFQETFEGLDKMAKFFDSEKAIDDILKKSGTFEASTDPLKKATGVPLQYAISQVRDRISSPFQRGVRLGTKAYQSGVEERTAKAITDLLTDPRSVDKVNEIMAKQVSGKLPFNAFVNEFTSIMGLHIRGSSLAGAREGLKAEGNNEDEQLNKDFEDILKRRGMK